MYRHNQRKMILFQYDALRMTQTEKRNQFVISKIELIYSHLLNEKLKSNEDCFDHCLSSNRNNIEDYFDPGYLHRTEKNDKKLFSIDNE